MFCGSVVEITDTQTIPDIPYTQKTAFLEYLSSCHIELYKYSKRNFFFFGADIASILQCLEKAVLV